MPRCVFIGRKEELETLRFLHNRQTPSLVVIKGRRRIGKSRLVTEFASECKDNRLWNFAGLAPQDGLTAQGQREYFARQLSLILKAPPMTFTDWSDALEHLSLHIRAGDVILFDEIAWMGSQDPGFVPKLKAWWDRQATSVLLVFCGPSSKWIEENILNHTAFFGRINRTLTLDPLSLSESKEFLQSLGFKCSPYDAYMLLSLLGGVPGNLEQVNPQATAEENIQRLAFQKDGFLVSEFNKIFYDLFNEKRAFYKKILDSLKNGAKTLAEIRKAIGFSHSGTLSSLMKHLITAGFVQKQCLWSFKTAQPLKQSLYRIDDLYIQFYLKVIEPLLNAISSGACKEICLSTLPGWEEILKLQLESLLLQNRLLLLKAIGVSPMDVVCEGPYRQSATKARKECQIDYLVQTRTKNLFICAFRLGKRELGIDVINDIQDKVDALKIPKGFAPVPVLFHLSGVSSSLDTDPYFYRIIDIVSFLEDTP